MNAGDIIVLLEEKHKNDVCVPECKTGSTWIGKHRRIDLWAMKRSWAKPLVVAYEVKVSRSDFMGDNKWQEYLPYCNEFYFAAPPGLIEKNELPREVGLIETTKNGARLLTRKKAIYREVDIPDGLYRYLLICRTRIDPPNEYEDPRAYWERWLVQRKIDRTFGAMVGGQISRHYWDSYAELERENGRLSNRIKQFEEIERLCREQGVDPHESGAGWKLRAALNNGERFRVATAARKILEFVGEEARGNK